MGFLAAYLSKLLYRVPLANVALAFSGGIGENSAQLRADVLARLGWLGAEVDAGKNAARAQDGEVVRTISTAGSKLRTYVVLTDEEAQCAHMAREALNI